MTVTQDPWDAPDEDYITTGEAARLLGVSPKTVARWASGGRIPHIVTLGGHRRFPRSAVVDAAGAARPRHPSGD